MPAIVRERGAALDGEPARRRTENGDQKTLRETLAYAKSYLQQVGLSTRFSGSLSTLCAVSAPARRNTRNTRK